MAQSLSKHLRKYHSMERFPKLLCVVDGHEKADFFLYELFLALTIFLLHEILKKDQRMTRAKEVVM